MNAAELKEMIRGNSLLDVKHVHGEGTVYKFLLFAYDDPRKGGFMVSDFVCRLPNQEVETMFEEFQLKYAQQQIEQEL